MGTFLLRGPSRGFPALLIDREKIHVLGAAGQRDVDDSVSLVDQQQFLARWGNEALGGDVAVARQRRGYQLVSRVEVILQETQHPIASVGLPVLPVNHGDAGKLRWITDQL